VGSGSEELLYRLYKGCVHLWVTWFIAVGRGRYLRGQKLVGRWLVGNRVIVASKPFSRQKQKISLETSGQLELQKRPEFC
jgi:hypothetical protein